MVEHGALIAETLSAVASIMVIIIGALLSRDRKRIDGDIAGLKKAGDTGRAEICAKIERTRALAQEAHTKGVALELAQTKATAELHAHLSAVEMNLLREHGALKDLLAERFVTKAELHDFCRFHGPVEGGGD